jgi:hypothetical protein
MLLVLIDAAGRRELGRGQRSPSPAAPGCRPREQGSLDRRYDKAGEGLRVLVADTFVAQRRRDRPFPALEGGGRHCRELGVLGPRQGGGGDRAADSLGVVLDPPPEDLTEHEEGLAQAALFQRALDQVADRRPLQLGCLTGELDLAAGEVVVDRAARGLAALGDVAQLHPGVALLRQQLPGAVEQQRTTVPALRFGRLTVGYSRYAHGHSL